MIPATLVLGAHAVAREQAIAHRLDLGARTALILEGIPTGASPLDDLEQLEIARIVAGCPCCDGNLVLRVTLNRLLRRKPSALYIALATSNHAEQLRDFLQRPPYDSWLYLTKDLHA